MVAAAPSERWASSRPARCSADTSGWSPERTTTGPPADSISPRAARTADPVPSPSVCSASSTPSGRPFGHAVAGPHHADDAIGAGLATGIHDPLEHGLAADAVEHLRKLRPHPSPPPGGHDQDREGLSHSDLSVPAKSNRGATGEGGIGPPFRGPKPRVLPLDHSPSTRRRRYHRPRPAQRSLRSRGTRPASAPASWAGPPGGWMPSTRIAFRPSESRSRPSVDDTSRPDSSRTRSSR